MHQKSAENRSERASRASRDTRSCPSALGQQLRASWAPAGPNLGTLGRLRKPPGTLLGHSWALLGGSWGALGVLLGALGRSWGALGPQLFPEIHKNLQKNAKFCVFWALRLLFGVP